MDRDSLLVIPAGGLEFLLVLEEVLAMEWDLSLVMLARGLESLLVPETGIGYEAGFVI